MDWGGEGEREGRNGARRLLTVEGGSWRGGDAEGEVQEEEEGEEDK